MSEEWSATQVAKGKPENVPSTHEVETIENDDTDGKLPEQQSLSKIQVKPLQKQEEKPEKELDPEQVQEFVEKLEYIVKNTKNTELIETGLETLKQIKEENKAEKNIVLKKFQCLKCKEVFETEESYTGHFHGNPDCGGVPRWMSDYKNPEEQKNTIRI